MKKLVYLLYPREASMTPAERRVRLLEKAAPALLEHGARYLQLNVADDRVGVSSPAPTTPLSDEPFVAQASLWLDDDADRHPFEDVLRSVGFDLHGYLVEESLYTEYGENPHAPKRDWPDGQRSPGVLAVTALVRPKHIPKDEWMRRWWGRQSPMSEAMQPRSRYVRNVVREVLTEGAPAYEGIVEEAWPSAKHVEDPFLFYGAKNPLALLRNLGIMLSSVTDFLPLWNIPNVMTSEYFVKSPFATDGVSSPADRR